MTDTDTDTDTGTEATRDEGVSTLAKQGSITFVGNVVNGAFGFAIVMLMTRYVTPSVYGLFVLATSVILFMQVFANLGLPLAIDYFVPQYLDEGEHGKAKGVIVQVTATVLITSALVAFVLAAGSEYIGDVFQEPSMRIALLFLSVTIPMLAIYNVLLTSYYSIKKLQYRVIMRDLVRPIVRFGVTAALLLAGFGLLGLIAGYVVGLFVAITVGAALFTYKAWDLLTVDTELVASRPLLTYSLPLAMTSVVFVLMGHVDYFVLGFFLDSDDVGIYRVGYMLGSGLMIIFNSLSPVFKPLIAETREDTALVEQRFRVAARWIAGITLPIAIILSLGASSYLAVLYTPQYAEASLVVVLLCGAFLFNVTVGGPDGSLLQGMGYSRIVFANTLVLFGANFLVSMALVPIFGIEGAAIGSATALFLVGGLTIAEIYYLDGIHLFTRDFAKIISAGIPATIAGVPIVVLLESDLLIVALLPVVVVSVYLATLIVTDAFTDEDAQMIGEFSPTVEKWLPVS
ncbi:putative transport protein (probable polysaccharide biosynthesis transport protein) [Natrialba magadii ATCC 43099]|uniref:Polysaccharide biosynthesis protein n=1 Tax=Natrialba magadii (strain ATCC 43099 / DSM 3394 / CCM 3739 / CIP 104546 / IAM 13178 / JCM 8861 / NBRC 102185 / NCIMB 2190 / MS3) TaxID=547559 RepID=D3SXR8_NATMM|nr:flippase [Natrialba magadii]ADD06017.1 putative transport protein (probable polysaccharide biosynthesis transport protein) [Natrialba magadii ATCC 43099]ELY30474.1 polysaccharide biosynthesis protein [Natrialba magadii ATCC 43099]